MNKKSIFGLFTLILTLNLPIDAALKRKLAKREGRGPSRPERRRRTPVAALLTKEEVVILSQMQDLIKQIKNNKDVNKSEATKILISALNSEGYNQFGFELITNELAEKLIKNILTYVDELYTDNDSDKLNTILKTILKLPENKQFRLLSFLVKKGFEPSFKKSFSIILKESSGTITNDYNEVNVYLLVLHLLKQNYDQIIPTAIKMVTKAFPKNYINFTGNYYATTRNAIRILCCLINKKIEKMDDIAFFMIEKNENTVEVLKLVAALLNQGHKKIERRARKIVIVKKESKYFEDVKLLILINKLLNEKFPQDDIEEQLKTFNI
ncbi:MAG: hypothetical protein ABIF12_03605 [bacterium]